MDTVSGSTRVPRSGPVPTLPVPAGWTPAFLPGADLLMMPLAGGDRVTPVFTVRHWDTQTDLPAGHSLHDPRTDSAPGAPRFGAPDGPAPVRGVPVGMDRWSGGAWFGLRFLRTVPSVAGRPVAEVRWLLWSAERGLPADFDEMTTMPSLDVTFLCAVADLVLVEMIADSMAGAVPADWAPALSPGHPSPQSLVGVQYREKDPDATPPLSEAGVWAGAALLEITPAALETLKTTALTTPTGPVPGGAGPSPVEAWSSLAAAGLAGGTGPQLTERGVLAAIVLQGARQVSTLTLHSRHGSHRSLELYLYRGIVAVVAHALPVPGLQDEVLLGLHPAERSAEMVLRSAGLGPSDSRRLTVDTVDREVLLRRVLAPDTPSPEGMPGGVSGGLPEDLAADPRWREIWAERCLLWTLETRDIHPAGEGEVQGEGQGEEDGAARGSGAAAAGRTLMALNAGRWGNHVLTRPDGTGGSSTATAGARVRLVPASTSGLFITLQQMLSPGPTVPDRQ